MAERFKTPGDAVRLGVSMRSARKKRRMTITYVAEQTGVDAGQLSKMERGQMATASKNVQKVCNFFQIPATTGKASQTRVGSMLDQLIDDLPGSEPAVARLVAAIQEMVLSLAAHSTHKKVD